MKAEIWVLTSQRKGLASTWATSGQVRSRRCHYERISEWTKSNSRHAAFNTTAPIIASISGIYTIAKEHCRNGMI